MKKRLIALLMATTMVIGLTACGGGGGGTTADTSSDTTTEATDDASDKEEVTIEVNVAQVDWADAWDVMEERFEEQYQWINLRHVGTWRGRQLPADKTFHQGLTGHYPGIRRAASG